MTTYHATITHHTLAPSPSFPTTLRFPVDDPKDIYDHLRRPTDPDVTLTVLVVTSTTSTTSSAPQVVLLDARTYH